MNHTDSGSIDVPADPQSKSKLVIFAAHAIWVIGASILALFLPLYSLSTGETGVYALSLVGWAGDPAIAARLGMVATADYSTLWWSYALATGGACTLLAFVWKQGSPSLLAWGVLTTLAAVPILAGCVQLAQDAFPMPFEIIQVPANQSVILAGWEAPLWALAIAVACASAGLVQQVFHPIQKGPINVKLTEPSLNINDLESLLLDRVESHRNFP